MSVSIGSFNKYLVNKPLLLDITDKLYKKDQLTRTPFISIVNILKF